MNKDIITSKEELYQWYVKEKRTYRWIMKRLEINNARKVKKLLTENNIPIRHGSEAIITQWIDNEKRRIKTSEMAKKSFKPYWGKLTKSPEVREKIRLSKIGEKNPMFGMTKEKHHNYLGGKSNWMSGRKISKRKIKEAFEVLGEKCNRCGSTQKLTINHKIPYREVRHHELWNLEILCSKCHFYGPIRLR